MSSRLSALRSRSSTRQRDVPDVEVQRVAEDQQEEHGDEEQDEQRSRIAHNLPQLLASDGEAWRMFLRVAIIGRAAPLAATPATDVVDDAQKDVLERRTDDARRRDVDAGLAQTPRRSPSTSRVPSAQDGVHRRAEQAGVLHLGHRLEHAHGIDGRRGVDLDDGAVR